MLIKLLGFVKLSLSCLNKAKLFVEFIGVRIVIVVGLFGSKKMPK